jgi:periplasmic divalent cation tolerance protein
MVYSTTDKQEEAEKIAEVLVEKKLAACIQILPQVTSVYSWQGKVVKDQEWLLIMKTIYLKYEQLEREIKKLHSYETPEIVAVTIETGSDEYLQWVKEILTDESG